LTLEPRQKKILTIAIGIFILMSLIPPWAVIHTHSGGATYVYLKGPAFIMMPPSGGEDVHIDYSRLLLQWIVLAVATAGLILVGKDSNKD